MQESSLTHWSGLPRVLSADNRFHRAILLLSATAGFAGAALAALGLRLSAFDSALRGLAVAAAAFATWVIARELDPDHPRSAFVGPPAAGLLVAWVGAPGWLAVAWSGISLRIVNRSTGLASTLLDTIGYVLLSLVVGWIRDPLFLILSALVLGLDGTLQSSHRLHRALAWILAGIGVAVWILSPASFARLASKTWLGLLAGMAAYLGWVWLQPAPRSVGDYTGEPLTRARVRAGQGVAALVALASMLTLGPAAVQALSPLLAAMLGVAAYGWVVWFRARWAGGR